MYVCKIRATFDKLTYDKVVWAETRRESVTICIYQARKNCFAH